MACGTDSIRVPNALIVAPPAENRGLHRRSPRLRQSFRPTLHAQVRGQQRAFGINRATPPT
jgi:hypothetical protein